MVFPRVSRFSSSLTIASAQTDWNYSERPQKSLQKKYICVTINGCDSVRFKYKRCSVLCICKL